MARSFLMPLSTLRCKVTAFFSIMQIYVEIIWIFAEKAVLLHSQKHRL
jgi:hypothetical protein